MGVHARTWHGRHGMSAYGSGCRACPVHRPAQLRIYFRIAVKRQTLCKMVSY
jgi:hypothetical protein